MPTAKGFMILEAEAQAPAAVDNVVDKPEAESAALLAGSILLSAAGGGGIAFLATPQADSAWAVLASGQRGLRVQHSTMMNQCLTATQIRSFHGFLPGAAVDGAPFSVHGFPATAMFEQSASSAAVTRVHLSAPAVWASPHICSVEEFAGLTGQKFVPVQTARTQVDDTRAATLLRHAEAQGVHIPAGRLAELYRDVTQAAGQNMLPGAGGETTAGALCAFAVATLGVPASREFGVAVGRAEMTASGARITDHGEASLPRLGPVLQAAVEQMAARLGPQWDLLTLATVRALGQLPMAARRSPALIAGSIFRQKLLQNQWWVQPAPLVAGGGRGCDLAVGPPPRRRPAGPLNCPDGPAATGDRLGARGRQHRAGHRRPLSELSRRPRRPHRSKGPRSPQAQSRGGVCGLRGGSRGGTGTDGDVRRDIPR